MEEQLARYREWQKQNPEWELCCDIQDTDALYVQWEELLNRERKQWISDFHDSAKNAFDEFAIKRCKVQNAVLCPDMQIRDVMDWPNGFCMLVFKTDNQSFNRTIKGAAD